MNETRFNEYIKKAIKAYDELMVLHDLLEKAMKKEATLWLDYIEGSDGIVIPSERMFIKSGDALYEVEFDVDDYDKPTIRRVDGYTTFMEDER